MDWLSSNLPRNRSAPTTFHSGGLLRNVELGTSGVDTLPVERGPYLTTSTLDSDTSSIVVPNSSAEPVGTLSEHVRDIDI